MADNIINRGGKGRFFLWSAILIILLIILIIYVYQLNFNDIPG